jgi:hypothetical protein
LQGIGFEDFQPNLRSIRERFRVVVASFEFLGFLKVLLVSLPSFEEY